MKTQKRKVHKIIFTLLAASSLAFANNYDFYDNNQQTISTKHIRVTKSVPVYENINERIPHQECWDERVRFHHGGHNNNPINDSIGTLIGGIAGGLLGNQIGGGSGKTVATIGGAILGSSVGTNLSRDRRANNVRYETVRKCNTNYRYNSKRVLSGYNNIGYYKGQKIVKFANERLGSIPVTITLSY